MTKTKTQLTTKNKNTEVSNKNNLLFQLSNVDDESLDLMKKDAKDYKDNTSPEDLAIPRIKIIQSGSDERKKNNSKYIEDAEEGDLINTLTQQIYSSEDGLLFIPAIKRVVYLEWRSKEKGGGLVKNYGEDATTFLSINPDENGKKITKDGNEIIKTYDFFGYVLNLENKQIQQVVISMQKTQAKKAKNWNSIMRELTTKDGTQLPIYAGVYKLTTVPESNDKGSWFNYKIELAGYTLGVPEIGNVIYNKAKMFSETIKQIKVNYEDDAEENSESSDERL